MRINPTHVKGVINASSGKELWPFVQMAIELEHATIPPYLCGMFTLKLGTNTDAEQIIRSVVIEEMLHFTIASNLLTALGGSPAINNPKFVPEYPTGLPMGIGDGLQVPLKPCSVEQVRDVFMAIEEPEEQIYIPVEAMLEAAPQFDTIGQFYSALSTKIGELGDAIFVGDPARQVVAIKWFPDPDEMFAITDVANAQKGIEVIMDQGEGTSTDPFVNPEFNEGEEEPAHYYRFAEIVNGRRLIHKPGATPPFAYAGDSVVLDTANIWDMDPNPTIARYKPGSRSRRMAEQFAYSYTRALNCLHEAFNGDPSRLDDAMGVMYELRLLAQQVLATPAEFADAGDTRQVQTGLCFEFNEVNQ